MVALPFNRPFLAGNELAYLAQAVDQHRLAGDGVFTTSCARLLEDRFKLGKVLLTPSCTAALEIAVQLLQLRTGDEVILPSFTFVSTASAVVRGGGTPVFVDIRPDTLNLDERLIEAAITARTKAIIPVHYAGVACDMDAIGQIAASHSLTVIEDAAQGVNAFYRGRALGSLGQLGCYSFHETKNYTCGEGGALCINDPSLIARAEILRHKGTNRSQFLRGQADKYTWVDLGSAHVLSELNAAFLLGQLEQIEVLAQRRRSIYDRYFTHLRPLEAKGLLRLPIVPRECSSNHHLFYVLLPDRAKRDRLLEHLQAAGVHAVFHYVPLHSSPMGRKLGCDRRALPITDDVSGRLVRLPLFYAITEQQQEYVTDLIAAWAQRSARRAA